MNRERRKELSALKRVNKAEETAVLKQLTALRKAADKIVRVHRRQSASRARRIAILESRLG